MTRLLKTLITALVAVAATTDATGNAAIPMAHDLEAAKETRLEATLVSRKIASAAAARATTAV